MAVDSAEAAPAAGDGRADVGTDGLVRYELRDAVALVTMSRPDQLNAVNTALVTGLCDCLDRADADRAAATVLAGSGRAFCAGHDFTETIDGESDDEARRRIQRIQDVTRKIRQLPGPVIAAVHGYALGAGCEFALACDLVVADASAVFGFPEVEVGLAVTGGVTHLLPLLLGPAKAKELVLLGRRIGAEEALALGLVNAVVEDALDHALAWASELASRPRAALSLAKAGIDQGLEGGIDAAFELEVAASLALRNTPESAAASEAFRRRRRDANRDR